jgi:hypothetical protein
MHLPHHHAETSTTTTPAPVAMVRRSCDQAVDQVHVARFPAHPSGCEPLGKSLPLDRIMMPLRVTGSILTGY